MVERQVPHARFCEVFVPAIQRKLGASGIRWIRKREEWEAERERLRTPSLFPEREVVFLEGLGEKEAFSIVREAREYPQAFFFCLLSPDALKETFWQEFPWIVVGESKEAFFRFLETEAKRLGVTLEGDAQETLLHLVTEYELQEGDIQAFLEAFRGGRVGRGEIEAFFIQSEKVLLFRFLDALSEKNAPQALRYAYRLMDHQFPPALLVANLARRFRLLAQFYETGERRKDLLQGRELNPFEARKIEKMQQYFRPSDLPRVFATLRAADRLLKTQSVDSRLWCAILVAQITQPEQAPG